MTDPGSITEQVINAVLDADLVVADLSERNPNAFYELGIRHVVRKPVIHLIGIGSDIPFDNKDYRTIAFDPLNLDALQATQVELCAHIETIFKAGYKVSNPVTLALGAKALRLTGDPKDKIIADLVEQVRSISVRIEEIENTSEHSRALQRMAEQLPIPDSNRFGHAKISVGHAIPLKHQRLIDALMGKDKK